MIEQHVDTFEAFLRETGAAHRLDPELVAAKLMGRWRNGSPISEWPEHAAPHADKLGNAQLDSFDYESPPGAYADRLGARCPIGSHVRRMHPRSGLVLGVPWGRRLIRRGMPYELPRADGGTERGLFGLFFCGDLEQQFEFLQRVWANEGFSAPGLRGTQDIVIGSRDGTTPFTFTPTDTAEPITVHVPPLTRTAGSLYLFYPGLQALCWIGARGWLDAAPAQPTVAALPPAPRLLPEQFAPYDPTFAADPYRHYTELRLRTPVAQVDWTRSVWVTSHALVREINERTDVFLKPGSDRDPTARPFDIAAQFADGLFFMDPPRHTQVRPMLDADFGAAIERVAAYARQTADTLLRAALAPSAPFDLVATYAARLPMQIFMGLMGIPPSDQTVVDVWTRALMQAHSPAAKPEQQLFGATAALALRSYFVALAKEGAVAQTPWGTPTLMRAMAARSGCPMSAGQMAPDEVMNSALHFALGGYLSTEFLLATGVHHLLTGGPPHGNARANRDAWMLLRGDRALLPQAIAEMIRYDAPFQMADRWVAADTELGGVTIAAGSKVVAVYGSANRDPERDGRHDARAGEFDIRRPAAAHFGFGGGPHTCIGAPLALTVTAAALGALLDACPDASIAEVGQWSPDPYFRTLDRLMLNPA